MTSVRAGVIAGLLVMALAACTSPAPTVTATVTATATGSAPAATVTGTATASPTPSGTPTPTPSPHAVPDTTAAATGTGCPRTAATTPADAISTRIDDIDGDGRADIYWARIATTGMQFGVTTASGATVSHTIGFAGGGARSFVMGRLANGTDIALPSDGRSAQLFTWYHCRFVETDGVDRKPYTFVLGDLLGPGTGTGVGCIHGSLYGFEATTKDGGHHFRITATHVYVNPNGHFATNEGISVLASDLDADGYAKKTPPEPPLLAEAGGVSCGGSVVLHPVEAR